jgi:hypothetical protein
LCSQLARRYIPDDVPFVRNATPDAGVECYSIQADGSEWGWQAKYFINTFDSSQWSQIDESVISALNKHPQLTRYIICTPLDFPDGRSEGKKSGRQKWDEHVEKWSGWAHDRDMSVKFIYWGSFELLNLLSLPKNLGLLSFWFGAQYFDDEWFTNRLEEAVKAAGPRYTPEIHVDVAISKHFEAFGRTSLFFKEIKLQSCRLQKELQHFDNCDFTLIQTPKHLSSLSKIKLLTQSIIFETNKINESPVGELPFNRIVR